MDNLASATIELQHIELELRSGRNPQHLRSFVDQYFCYKKGYVKEKSGRADWEAMVWKEAVSIEARRLSDRKQVVREHMVPLSVITRKLVRLAESGDLSCETISALLDRYVHCATITQEEDKDLRKNGLRSRMPLGFETEGHLLYDDVWCRYRAVGIVLEPRSSESASHA